MSSVPGQVCRGSLQIGANHRCKPTHCGGCRSFKGHLPIMSSRPLCTSSLNCLPHPQAAALPAPRFHDNRLFWPLPISLLCKYTLSSSHFGLFCFVFLFQGHRFSTWGSHTCSSITWEHVKNAISPAPLRELRHWNWEWNSAVCVRRPSRGRRGVVESEGHCPSHLPSPMAPGVAQHRWLPGLHP